MALGLSGRNKFLWVGAHSDYGPKRFIWEGESILLSSSYYSDSYSQIVDPNNSVLFNIFDMWQIFTICTSLQSKDNMVETLTI